MVVLLVVMKSQGGYTIRPRDESWRKGPRRSVATEQPLVSVIIPCYNYSVYLPAAIRSVLKQTYKNLETIVVNDGSTDQTEEVLGNYPVFQVRQRHQGFAVARNNGIKHSSGEFFLCLDGDDKVAPSFVEKTMEKMLKKPDVGFVTTGSRIYYEDSGLENIWMPRKIRFKYSLFAGWVAALGTVLMRRSAFDSLSEGYDPTLPAHEDLDICFRILDKGWKSETVFEPLHWYRRHETLLDPQVAEKRRIAAIFLDQKYWFRQPYRLTYSVYKSTIGRIVSLMSHPPEYLKAFQEKTDLRVQLSRTKSPVKQLEAKEYLQQLYSTLDMQVEWAQNKHLHDYYDERVRILKSRLERLSQ